MKRAPIIKTYKGFASEKIIYIHGHVLKSESKLRERVTSNPLKNVLEMYRRYNVSAAKNVKVQLELKDEVILRYDTYTDRKGYFYFKVERSLKFNKIPFRVSLKTIPDVNYEGVIEKKTPELIIVSDIDDTILVSHATNMWKKLYLLLTKSHESRKTFQGIRNFYHGLILRNNNTSFFYVSSSEWNLYDFLDDFVKFNELPHGIFLLQDLKSGILDLFKSGGGSHVHKKDKIFRIMESFPDAKYILVGDSGQKDPDLYREIALDKPDLIRSIYIRDVRSSKKEKVQAIAEQLKASNINMELFSDIK